VPEAEAGGVGDESDALVAEFVSSLAAQCQADDGRERVHGSSFAEVFLEVAGGAAGSKEFA
jgi:hypothetical protein